MLLDPCLPEEASKIQVIQGECFLNVRSKWQYPIIT